MAAGSCDAHNQPKPSEEAFKRQKRASTRSIPGTSLASAVSRARVCLLQRHATQQLDKAYPVNSISAIGLGTLIVPPLPFSSFNFLLVFFLVGFFAEPCSVDTWWKAPTVESFAEAEESFQESFAASIFAFQVSR